MGISEKEYGYLVTMRQNEKGEHYASIHAVKLKEEYFSYPNRHYDDIYFREPKDFDYMKDEKLVAFLKDYGKFPVFFEFAAAIFGMFSVIMTKKPFSD